MDELLNKLIQLEQTISQLAKAKQIDDNCLLTPRQISDIYGINIDLSRELLRDCTIPAVYQGEGATGHMKARKADCDRYFSRLSKKDYKDKYFTRVS